LAIKKQLLDLKKDKDKKNRKDRKQKPPADMSSSSADDVLSASDISIEN
jgi:hypothetical protein